MSSRTLASRLAMKLTRYDFCVGPDINVYRRNRRCHQGVLVGVIISRCGPNVPLRETYLPSQRRLPWTIEGRMPLTATAHADAHFRALAVAHLCNAVLDLSGIHPDGALR